MECRRENTWIGPGGNNETDRFVFVVLSCFVSFSGQAGSQKLQGCRAHEYVIGSLVIGLASTYVIASGLSATNSPKSSSMPSAIEIGRAAAGTFIDISDEENRLTAGLSGRIFRGVSENLQPE